MGIYRAYFKLKVVLGSWVELPLISPQQLSASRLIKCALYGDIHRPITGTLPPFNGNEAHYLRCQVVRLAFNTQIAPNDVFKISETTNPDEKPERIERNNEYTYPGYEDLINLENWVHVNPALLKGGRASHFIPKSLSEDARAELLAKLEEKDPYIERLRPITADKRILEFNCSFV